MKKTQIFKNTLVSLGLSILETSRLVMHEFWYDYAKLEYKEKAKLCFIDIDSHIKTEDIYIDIAKDVETRLHTSSCELEGVFFQEKI